MIRQFWTALRGAWRASQTSSEKETPPDHAVTPHTRTVSLVQTAASLQLPPHQPDVLVEMGRDVASALVAHPERYAHAILGNQVLVVDDASYESLFYLFSGRTREQLYTEKHTIAALFLGRHCVMSQRLYDEARGSTEGLW